jgi:protein-disulfide isomerase
MVEFADLQCPFCKDFQKSTFPALDSVYIKTGKVRFVVRDFPLKNHPYARPAAEAVRCAGEQGKYWDLRDAILAESEPPLAATISAVAADIHLDMKEFEQCQSQRKFSSDIDAEQSEAERIGINGTPMFLIGRPGDGKVQGVVIQGNRSIDVYRGEIERSLKEVAGDMGNLSGASTTIHAPEVKPR